MSGSKKDNCSKKRSVKDLKKCIPLELNNGPIMEVCSDRQITVDGCRGIVEYSEYVIKIKTSEGIVSVSGKSLNIKYLSISSVVVEGFITCIEFLK